MFKRNKDEPKRTGRTRLDTLNSLPKLHDVRMLLVEAGRQSGSLCELPIRHASSVFVLSCQSDHLSPEPCWTLYQGEDGSQQIWSYMNNDLQMICDIVNMSIEEKCGASGVSAAFADVTSAITNELQAKEEENKPWGQYAAPAATDWGATQQPAQAPQPQLQPPMMPYEQQQQQFQQPMIQPQHFQQPMMQPQEFQQPMMQPQWENVAPAAPPAQSPSPWLTPSAAPVANHAGMTAFATVLEGKPNITIGEVLFLADIPAACVDSAMRLQEMVCKSEISEKTAVEALKIAAKRGSGVVDDTILSELRSRTNAVAEAARGAVSLLRDSGIITEADLNVAESTALEQGKDIGEILISTGKTDKLMLDGATKCVALIAESKIRTDQAIIALNYCMRARSPIDQAFDELSINI